MDNKLHKLAEEYNIVDPVGEVHSLPQIDQHLQILAEKWDEQATKEKQERPWWQFWQNWSTTVNLYKITKFLLDALDGLIILVDDAIEKGADKKATVLFAIDWLYEHVAQEAIPFLMRPFARQIKNYIIYTLISVAIDWIVEKYRNGEWKKGTPQNDEQGGNHDNGSEGRTE